MPDSRICMSQQPKVQFHHESFGYLANQMARLFEKRLATRLRPHGLAPAQFVVLLHLWEAAPLTQRELIERTQVEQATMVNTLNRMERDGLIARALHPADQRAWLIHPTSRACSLEPLTKSIGAAINEQALSGLTDPERELCRDLARRIIGNLQPED